MKYIFLILGTYLYAESSTAEITSGFTSGLTSGLSSGDSIESSGLVESREDDQWEKRKFEENHAGNDTFQSDFDGIIPVVFASENEKKFKIKKFIIKIDPTDPLYKKIKLIRLVSFESHRN